MRPTATVVIPTHNRRDLLLRTLRSALRQTLESLEIIVVDDGSSDGTADAVRTVADERIRLERNVTPARVAAARNQGAAIARGRWIALLDDDDLWSPGKLEQQIGAAERSDCRWVYGGAVEIDATDRLLGGEPPPSPSVLQNALASGNVMPAGCSNVVVRADLFREVGGFDERLRHLADWDLWLRLIAVGAPACVADPIVAYRMHGGQATLDPRGMIDEGRVLEARHGASLNSIRRWLAWSHLRRGERRLAVGSYARAVLAGDVSSLGRAAVAVLDRHPTAFRVPGRKIDQHWCRAAAAWLPPSAPEP